MAFKIEMPEVGVEMMRKNLPVAERRVGYRACARNADLESEQCENLTWKQLKFCLNRANELCYVSVADED
jgi:hypothetical protein